MVVAVTLLLQLLPWGDIIGTGVNRDDNDDALPFRFRFDNVTEDDDKEEEKCLVTGIGEMDLFESSLSCLFLV